MVKNKLKNLALYTRVESIFSRKDDHEEIAEEEKEEEDCDDNDEEGEEEGMAAENVAI